MTIRLLFCTCYILIGLCFGIQTATLRFYHGSIDNCTETPLDDPIAILPFFNKTLVSMFYVFGFSETSDSADATTMLTAYFRTRYVNVVLLDWSNEARIDSRGTVLSYIFGAVPNSRIVGRRFGRALVTLIQNGISETKIHLVGHSLGSHVAGFAGEFVQETGYNLARITGLDPAGPMFQGLVNMGGLNSGRANFVDVLHTNPSMYGVQNSIGSVDFWANCDGVVQPACPKDTTLDDLNSFCSHWRSFLLFSEAILFPTAFPAAKADSCTCWQNNTIQEVIYLGDLVHTSARGNYFFSTNDHQPFSKGHAGLVP